MGLLGTKRKEERLHFKLRYSNESHEAKYNTSTNQRDYRFRHRRIKGRKECSYTHREMKSRSSVKQETRREGNARKQKADVNVNVMPGCNSNWLGKKNEGRKMREGVKRRLRDRKRVEDAAGMLAKRETFRRPPERERERGNAKRTIYPRYRIRHRHSVRTYGSMVWSFACRIRLHEVFTIYR